MQTVNISEFRSHLLKYLEMASSGESVSVTSHGRLLATITPPAGQKESARDAMRLLAKSAIVHDVVSPTGSEWSAGS
jgi:prevent-host-death family protein